MQETEPRRLGRPRSAETLARDEEIYTLITEGARSRGELADQTGLPAGIVALAIGRLRRAERVEQRLDRGRIVWAIAEGTPCP